MSERRAVPVYLSLAEAADRCGNRAIRIKLDDLEAAPRQIPSARA
jgi:hypothetical protein